MVRLIIASMTTLVGAVTIPLATFDGAKDTTLPFKPVNDPVMGGQSTSSFSIDGGKGIFEGEVKVVPFLRAPGFCNLEAPGFGQKAITFPDITGTDGIAVEVDQTLPNGLTNWDVSIQTATTKKASRTGDAGWQADFTFEAGKTTYFVPYSAFTCSSRGRKLSNCGDLSAQLDELTQLGLGSDGVAGPFRLEISSIQATSTPTLLSEAGTVTLATFGPSDATYRTWRQQNDPVMGGASSGKFTVTDGVGTMEGTCAIIPSLKVPGFIKTTASAKDFADVSSCTGIELEVRTDTAYAGYRFDFGNDRSSCGKFFARGYKAPFTAPVGEFGKVQIPFNEFSRCWDDGSGEILKSCADDPSQCPTQARLQDLQAMSLWAEGVEGDVKIDLKSVGAYGCGTVV